ncbi:MAG: hypothetical protein AAGI44_07050 [Pseudomonadota bacterium]
MDFAHFLKGVAADLALIDVEGLPLFMGMTLLNGCVVSSIWVVLLVC